MSQAILNALKSRLAATTSLTAIVGTRIYLDVGVANAPLPLLVYRTTSTEVRKFMSGTSQHVMEFDFELFFGNSGTQDIHTAAAAIGTALATPLTVTGFDRATFVRVESGVPSFSDDGWTMTERYRATAFDT